MQEILTRLLEKARADQVFPGAVVGVVKANGERAVVSVGAHRYLSGSAAIAPDSIFDVASVTKTIPTSLLALQLLDQGKLHLDDQVIRWVPELRMAQRSQMTLRHLLTHTVSFDFSLSSLKDKTPEEILKTIFSTELVVAPGTTYAYVNATSILLGLVVERVSEMSLPELATQKLFTPLEMQDTTFFPEVSKLNRVVPTELDPWRGREIHGEVHDESAWRLREKLVVGSAGLFSTVPDLLHVVEMVLHGGRVGTAQLFSPAIITEMSRNQIPDLDAQAGLGWELDQPWMSDQRSSTTIGKTGFTGCMVVLDIPRGVGGVMLSNATYPRRAADRSGLDAVRRVVVSAILGSSNW